MASVISEHFTKDPNLKRRFVFVWGEGCKGGRVSEFFKRIQIKNKKNVFLFFFFVFFLFLFFFWGGGTGNEGGRGVELVIFLQ